MRLPEKIENGPVHHMIHIDSVKRALGRSLGCDPFQELRPIDWLTLEEQQLLALTRGNLFCDGLGELEALQTKFAYYPRDVWLYLLASEWQKIAQVEHFHGEVWG